jgi:type II secretory pathway component PulF
MPLYTYKLLNSTGRMEKGMVELPFADPLAAARYLERRGSVILKVTMLPRIVTIIIAFFNRRMGHINRLELAEFLNNMAMLVGAGVPVLSSLEEIRQDLKNPRLRKSVNFMCTDIENGFTLADAMNSQPHIFSTVVLHMIRIGEETGNLDMMLKKGSEHIRHIHEIISGTKRALMYPAILLCVVSLATFFWFWYVVPKIVTLFQDFGIVLPLPTRILIAISDALQQHGLSVLAGIFCIVVLSIFGRKTSYRIRLCQDKLILKTPILSGIVETALIARICEYLGMMLTAGISIIRTMDIIIDSMGNLVMKNKLMQSRESIKGGQTLAASLRQAKALHPFAVRMIAVGENTGRIEEQTAYVADLYREKISSLVQNLSKILEPILLGILGIIFAMIVMGLLLPVYDLITNIGGNY